MCGITGEMRFDGHVIDAAALQHRTDTLAHRGPDDSGVHVEGPIGLGHRRLSIIDVAGGHQPIFNEDRSIALVFNGEIYNYQEIRSQLVRLGHRFETKSDSEVIVHLYEERGESCVERLRGMFAFALWDRSRRRLLLARDRLGIKPLYYHANGQRLLFASELKAILADPSVSLDVDPDRVLDFFTYGYLPGESAAILGCRRVLPGHTLTIEADGRQRSRRYWELPMTAAIGGDEDAHVSSLLDLIDESVKIRLMSEVPLGAFLSGGIDSTAVVDSMSRSSTSDVVTASIGFEEAGYSELAYARETAERLGTRHHEFTVEAHAADILDTLAWHYDEPFADPSAVPTFYVSKLARSKVTVALSGDGGDENFAGYRRYYFDRVENRMRGFFPGFVRQGLIAPLARLYPKADWLPRPLRAKTLLQNLCADPARAYFDSVSMQRPERILELATGDWREQLQDYHPFRHFERIYRSCPASDPVSRAQFVDFHTWLVDDILTKVDRASMAHSLEVRVPLLDHELCEFAARLRPDWKLHGREGKRLLKKALSTRVPPDVLQRRKHGFDMPLKEWLRGELKDRIEQTVFAKSSRLAEYLDPARLRTVWSQHQSGLADHGRLLWACLMFETWHRRHIGPRTETVTSSNVLSAP
ncbi:MAG: asparagine synthase (glutamine-hydrolyzing) [Planctomycetota bacterium]